MLKCPKNDQTHVKHLTALLQDFKTILDHFEGT